VEEDYIEDFTGVWTGTGDVLGTGDTERMTLYPGQYMVSDIRNVGSGGFQILVDKYGTLGQGSPLIEYKDGDSAVSCEADSWTVYTGPFTSQGWVKVRVSYP